MKHAPLDVDGRRVRKVDTVRIAGLPDLKDMSPSGGSRCKSVIRYLVGKYKKVDNFDQYGCVGLNFAIQSGRCRGLRTVWMEPGRLRLPRSRHKARSGGRN